MAVRALPLSGGTLHTKLIAIGFALISCAVIGAASEATAEGVAYLQDPIWKSAPSRSDVNSALASKGNWREAVSVEADCQVNPDGALTACHFSTERMSWEGFEGAARALAPKFTAYVPREAATAKGPIHVIVDFRFESPDQPAAPIYLDDPELRTRSDAPAPREDYPDAAMKAGSGSGFGLVECEGAETGALVGCVVVKETPADVGFGKSAITFAQAINLNPWQDGKPIAGSKVRLPLYVDPPDAQSRPTFARQAIFQTPFRWQGRPYLPDPAVLEGTAGPYFPDRALRMGVDGSAVIECVLSANGELDDCVPVSESVPNFSFLDAAMRMAKEGAIKAKPRIVDGGPVDEEVVQVTVPFIANPHR